MKLTYTELLDFLEVGSELKDWVVRKLGPLTWKISEILVTLGNNYKFEQCDIKKIIEYSPLSEERKKILRRKLAKRWQVYEDFAGRK